MATIATTFQTFQAQGQRQDLVDAIYSIAPYETPGIKLMPKVGCKATLHEWQTQNLDAAADNPRLQGDDVATFAAVTPTVSLNNRTQIIRREVIVADTMEAIDKAGRASELAMQKLLKGREIRRDMEFVIFGTNKGKVAGAAATAPQLASALSWVATNDLLSPAGSPASPAGDGTNARTDGTQRVLDEALVYSGMQLAWTAGGQPDVLMAGPFNTLKVSGFQGNSTKFTDASSGKVIQNVKIIETPFGEIMLVANRFQRERDLWGLQMDLWALATLRPIQWKPLAKTGDAEKGMLITEFTIESRQEAGNFLVADLTVS